MDTIARLLSPTLDLRASRHDGDILLTVSPGNAPSIEITRPLSQLFQFSSSRPWSFRPLALRRADARLDGNALLLSADSDETCGLHVDATITLRDGLLHLRCRWSATGAATDAAVAFVLDLGPVAAPRLTLPHILYNGNPSAAAERLVPRFADRPGDSLICEETRYPVPAINAEWSADGSPVALSLYSLPQGDADWSLGVQRTADNSLQLLLASGVLSFNSAKDTTYGGQCKSVPLAAGYRTLAPGQIMEREVVVELLRPDHVGHGFRALVTTGYHLYNPRPQPCLTLEQVIDLKANVLASRWREEEGGVAGYLCMPPVNIYNRGPYFLFGWTGQGLRLAWCDAKLGFDHQEPERIARCRKAVDFYVHHSRAPVPALRYSHYLLDLKRWNAFEPGYDPHPHDPAKDTLSSRALGEAMWNLGKIVELMKEQGQPVPAPWVQTLSETADYLLGPASRNQAGFFPRLWSPATGQPLPGTVYAAGIPCVLALLAAHRATSADGSRATDYLRESVKLLDAYWRLCGDRFDRPFAGSTLDADCEDKEAAIYFFTAAAELFELTGEDRFRHYAEVAADWVLTFQYFWHTPFRPGTPCHDYGFIATGWSGVSVQNHHLDVFFPAAEMQRFARRTGNARLDDLSRLALAAWSHGIVQRPGHWQIEEQAGWAGLVPGDQYEQYYHTNFGPSRFKESLWRGGFIGFNPTWIIGMVLEGALLFRDMDRQPIK